VKLLQKFATTLFWNTVYVHVNCYLVLSFLNWTRENEPRWRVSFFCSSLFFYSGVKSSIRTAATANGRAPCSINEMLLTTEWTVRYTDRGQSRLQWRQLGHKKTIDRDCMVPRSAADRGHGGERCLLYTISATKWSGQTRSGPNHISRRRAGSGRYFFSLSASFNVPALLLLSRMPSCQYAEDLIGAPREKK